MIYTLGDITMIKDFFCLIKVCQEISKTATFTLARQGLTEKEIHANTENNHNLQVLQFITYCIAILVTKLTVKFIYSIHSID